jgi:hypothetical protein
LRLSGCADIVCRIDGAAVAELADALDSKSAFDRFLVFANFLSKSSNPFHNKALKAIAHFASNGNE